LFTGGFRRLSDEGLRFTNARHDHALTNSTRNRGQLLDRVQRRGLGLRE
jgi:hypothetical protein